MGILFYYLSSVFNASAQIGKALQTNNVICDRYIWTSLITHAAYFDIDLSGLDRVLKPFMYSLVEPDKTILLEVNEDEQLKRILLRNRDEPFNMSDRLCLNEKSS